MAKFEKPAFTMSLHPTEVELEPKQKAAAHEDRGQFPSVLAYLYMSCMFFEEEEEEIISPGICCTNIKRAFSYEDKIPCTNDPLLSSPDAELNSVLNCLEEQESKFLFEFVRLSRSRSFLSRKKKQKQEEVEVEVEDPNGKESEITNMEIAR
uniref:Uncharacterized protein n=1 Tax=Cucumis melo TaxID=3656 RepID=A0A9I9EEY5_CUCME